MSSLEKQSQDSIEKNPCNKCYCFTKSWYFLDCVFLNALGIGMLVYLLLVNMSIAQITMS